MNCPRCNRLGRKEFGGYCSKVHYKLAQPPKYLRLECASCGRVVVRAPSRAKGDKVFCARCAKNSGETHPRWREGQYFNPAGYRLVLYKDAYVLEHRLTWEQANHACILPEADGIIHHINFDKADNRPQNLVLLDNRTHGRIHRLLDAKKYDKAKWILVSWLSQQSFFLQQPEFLENIQGHFRDVLGDH